ncbi:MAG: ROK family protein [Roseiflexaceae bacterium]|nr:ROK family protein [Roseiflexaceae bacterium]
MQQNTSDSLLEKATRQHTKGHNSRLVLRTIYEYGEISRAGLARLTHLTRATVSEVVSDLIELHLVEEVGQGSVAVGRTPTLLSVVDDARQVAAISVTNDQVRGALVNLRGVLRRDFSRTLPSLDGDTVLATIYSLVDELIQAADRPLLGIGINTPGLIDTAAGTVVRAVTFGWVDLPLRALLQERSGLPVYVANDSHSLALAEYMFGPGQGTPNLVVIKVGLGIGAGIVIGGHLYAGEGYGAGEIGHLVVEEGGERCKCGNQGCLETVASSAMILRRARALAEADPASLLHRLAVDAAALTLADVAAAAEAGDEGARRIIAATGRALAVVVASLVSVLNVRRILITGRVAALGEQLRVAVCDELAHRALPALVQGTAVEVAAMSPDAPLLGAAAPLLTYELGLERLMQRPPLPRAAVEQATWAGTSALTAKDYDA